MTFHTLVILGIFAPLLGAAIAASLAACTTTSPDVIQRGDAQRLSTVQDGTVWVNDGQASVEITPVRLIGN